MVGASFFDTGQQSLLMWKIPYTNRKNISFEIFEEIVTFRFLGDPRFFFKLGVLLWPNSIFFEFVSPRSSVKNSNASDLCGFPSDYIEFVEYRQIHELFGKFINHNFIISGMNSMHNFYFGIYTLYFLGDLFTVR